MARFKTADELFEHISSRNLSDYDPNIPDYLRGIIVDWVELQKEISAGYLRITWPSYKSVVQEIVTRLAGTFKTDEKTALELLEKYSNQLLEIIPGTPYKEILNKRISQRGCALEDFTKSLYFQDIWNRDEFTPDEASSVLAKLSVPEPVIYIARCFWVENHVAVKPLDIDLIARIYNITKSLSTRGILNETMKALVPSSSFRFRNDPSMDAITYLNVYWDKAIKAGITQLDVNYLDPDLLPAVQEQVKELKQKKMPVPKFKWPRIARTRLEKTLADINSPEAQAYLENKRAKQRQANKRHQQKVKRQP